MNARTIDDGTWQFAQERLLEQWSPEQISGHVAISPETVYQRVYADKRAGGLLWKNLRCQKQRKPPLVNLSRPLSLAALFGADWQSLISEIAGCSLTP